MRKLLWLLLFVSLSVSAETTRRVVDVPSRPGVTQRFLLLTPDKPRAAVILFAGGHGGLDIKDDGGFGWGAGNFLVRTRDLFAEQGLVVAVIDKPSDWPNLNKRRQTPEHVQDVQAVMNWLRTETKLPVWLVGTSRGTQSVGYVAAALAGAKDSPDGIVLTSTILSDRKGRPVPELALDRLTIPVLVVHHENDGCEHCKFGDIPGLMQKLTNASRKEMMPFSGGISTGDPCEAKAYHGFNGIEKEVVGKIAAWMFAK